MTTATRPEITSGLDVLVARRRAGLKQYQLAQRLSISPTILCDLEHDRRDLTEDMAEQIVQALEGIASETV